MSKPDTHDNPQRVSSSPGGSRFWRRLQLRLRSLFNRWFRRLESDLNDRLAEFTRQAEIREASRQAVLLDAVDQTLCGKSAVLVQRVQETVDRIVREETVKRLIDGLIEMADDFRVQIKSSCAIEAYALNPHMADAIEIIKLAQSRLLELLATLDVAPIDPREGRFDPACQRPIDRVQTQDPELDQHICNVIRPGFKRRHSVWRQELITIFYFSEEKRHGQ
jgi:molecular chaperone GrpE (heat shock protein)